ncbi:MAG: rhodanese-like domain-containing protein [Epsilonproteobacteria bacterium]|nr:rhodanese-like domain-containing protein [Campylobacterota bacterium]
MTDIISKMDGKFLKNLRVTSDDIIEWLLEDEIVLLDVRYSHEAKLWGFSFTTNIPLNQLPYNLDKLPKDKLIVCICPYNTRSNMACMYLLTQGYNAKFSDDGMIHLAQSLRGDKAHSLKDI